MQFRTELAVKPSANKMDYTSKILMIGSCFAENIGEKLTYYHFPSMINPMGILFQPTALQKWIERVVYLKNYQETDFFKTHENIWQCYDLHSKNGHENLEEALNLANLKLQKAHDFLLNATHICITFGTAWVYELKESKDLVANCHKMPASLFEKKLLGVEEIQTSISKMMQLIHQINPKASIVFTISPVRHLKDGFVENQLSKSHLFAALHSINHQLTTINYFPSYEIMMDDLRDYRFYGADMIHPNPIAIDYIWEKFSEVYFSEITRYQMEIIGHWQKLKSHRTLNSSKITTSTSSKLSTLELQIREFLTDF
ncbi:MAG: GSCFA domain-containing protein [Flavobacterium sp.]